MKLDEVSAKVSDGLPDEEPEDLASDIGPDRSDCAWCSSHLSRSEAARWHRNAGLHQELPLPQIDQRRISSRPNSPVTVVTNIIGTSAGAADAAAPQFDRARGAKDVCLSSHPADDLHADRQTVFGESDRTEAAGWPVMFHG